MLCHGHACEYLVNLWGSYESNGSAHGGGGTVIHLSREQFCEKLDDRKPDQCDVDDPPLMPWQQDWETNGCGSGGISNWVASQAGFVTGISGWTGNLDEPLDGVSFLGACEAHDRCYYGGLGGATKRGCDDNFDGALTAVCSDVPFYQQSACGSVADMYVAGVENMGNDAWESNHEAAECYWWAKDMQQSECDQ